MANDLIQRLEEILQLVSLADDKLFDMQDELETAIGGYSVNVNLLNKTLNLTSELRGVLPILIRRIPRGYTPESYDHKASKLESRINRLERLMKK